MKRGRGAGGAPRPAVDAADIGRRLVEWCRGAARALPWRAAAPGRRDPYAVLVSEAMLQQTQVSRVVERFSTFMERFPTVAALAAADEHEVLALWSGLGYYRRARHLHAAARAVVAEHGGAVPSDVAALRRLPGVGRYTAGAIASIAHGRPAPIVDGNVARVLLRVHGREGAADDRASQAWLWERAEELARAAQSPGAVNEAVMELGATICMPPPAMPRCPECPLRDVCVARATGRQLEIPRPKVRAHQKAMSCGVAVVSRADGALLVEQRPGTGMWAGLWQAPTVEHLRAEPVDVEEVAAAVGIDASRLRPEASFEHLATHRRIVFRVWRGRAPAGFAPRRGIWMPPARIGGLALATPQRRILLEAEGSLWAGAGGE